MPDFRSRCYDSELMDDLEMEGKILTQTLDQLSVINRLLGGNAVTNSGVFHLGEQYRDLWQGRELEILDLGCGAGDGMRELAKEARKLGWKVRITGVDANPAIIEYAREHAREFPEIEFRQANCFDPDFRKQKFDLLICSLFLHHFTDEQLIELVPQLCDMCRIGLVVNDLHRHWAAYHLFGLMCSIFRASKMIRHDGMLSVRRAFKAPEMRQFLPLDGKIKAQLRWKWAFRYQMLIDTTAQLS